MLRRPSESGAPYVSHFAVGWSKVGTPWLSPKFEALLVSMHRSDDYTTGEFAELLDVACATVCGASARSKTQDSALTLPSTT